MPKRRDGDLARLGAFIRMRRQALGLTQTDLGRRIGYYQERISSLERGNYGMPSLPALTELSNALEVNLLDLIHAAGYEEHEAADAAVSGAAFAGGDVSHLRAETSRLEHGLADLHGRLSETEKQIVTAVELRQQMQARREEIARQLDRCRSAVR